MTKQNIKDFIAGIIIGFIFIIGITIGLFFTTIIN